MKLAIAGCGRIASVHYGAIEQLIQDKNYNVSISALIDIIVLSTNTCILNLSVP